MKFMYNGVEHDTDNCVGVTTQVSSLTLTDKELAQLIENRIKNGKVEVMSTRGTMIGVAVGVSIVECVLQVEWYPNGCPEYVEWTAKQTNSNTGLLVPALHPFELVERTSYDDTSGETKLCGGHELIFMIATTVNELDSEYRKKTSTSTEEWKMQTTKMDSYYLTNDDLFNLLSEYITISPIYITRDLSSETDTLGKPVTVELNMALVTKPENVIGCVDAFFREGEDIFVNWKSYTKTAAYAISMSAIGENTPHLIPSIIGHVPDDWRDRVMVGKSMVTNATVIGVQLRQLESTIDAREARERLYKITSSRTKPNEDAVESK